ncbi:hypothetical protein DIS24_g10764 [Lasiodiplodia hormozganensis]|uniref:Uncharacterized protein n=1 Tax=Lasiodiplodia hormozganensis TaxID=869390 RepID=A0AA39XPP2_9PEZI|nr:hypothetical protein DIS24_g10764 [Lasiodiplodia hormozganensis]
MSSWNPRHPIPSSLPAQPQENETEPPADNNSTPPIASPTTTTTTPFQAEHQQLQQAYADLLLREQTSSSSSSSSSEPPAPPPPYSAPPPQQPVNKHHLAQTITQLQQTVTQLQRANTHLRHALALASSRTNQQSAPTATASENASLWRALRGRDEVLQNQLGQLNTLQDELRWARLRAREMEQRVRLLEDEKRGWEEEEEEEEEWFELWWRLWGLLRGVVVGCFMGFGCWWCAWSWICLFAFMYWGQRVYYFTGERD